MPETGASSANMSATVETPSPRKHTFPESASMHAHGASLTFSAFSPYKDSAPGRRIAPTDKWSQETWAQMKVALSETITKKSNHVHKTKAGGATAYQYAMPQRAVAMVQVPVAIQPPTGVVEEEIVEEDIDVMENIAIMEKMFVAKIAERDLMWQRQLQELQARISVLNVSSGDPCAQSEIARLRTQIEVMQKQIFVLTEAEGEHSSVRVKIQAELDAKLKAIESHLRVINELRMDLERKQETIASLELRLRLEAEEKEKLRREILDRNDQAVFDVALQRELSALVEEVSELKKEKICLLADVEGAQVHINRQQGIISLLQVKLAERDDLRIKASFDTTVTYVEGQKHEDVRSVSSEMKTIWIQETTEKYESKIKEIHVELDRRDLEIRRLRLELQESRNKEKDFASNFQQEQDNCHDIISKIKKSYEYLDKCIMVEPQAYRGRHNVWTEAIGTKKSASDTLTSLSTSATLPSPGTALSSPATLLPSPLEEPAGPFSRNWLER